MEELYIETKNGKTPIEPAVSKKYNLEKGLKTPFTNQKIVNQNGEFPAETDTEKDPQNSGGKSLTPADTDTGSENVPLTTSEIIDFSQGTDSIEH